MGSTRVYCGPGWPGIAGIHLDFLCRDRICSMRLFCCCASPGSAKTIGESRRICRCGRASGKSFSESHPSLGIAGRNAAGGCHFFQELRSCGSDERPTGRDRDQLGQLEGLSHGPDSQIAPDGRPLTALGGPRNQPEASRILRRDCGIDVEGAKTPRLEHTIPMHPMSCAPTRGPPSSTPPPANTEPFPATNAAHDTSRVRPAGS
jgi:hypothetical protein